MPKKLQIKTSKHIELLKAVQKHETITKISKHTGINYHTVRYRLNFLVKLGLVHSVSLGGNLAYGLTDYGKEFLLKHLSMGVEDFKWRLHRNEFTFKILEKPSNWDKQKPIILMKQGYEFKQARLNNNTVEFIDFFDVTVKVCNNVVVVYLNEVYAPTPQAAEIKAMNQLAEVFPKIDRHLKKLGITIKKPSFGVDATNTQHYARENDTIAVAVHRKGGKIMVMDGDGKPRVTSDTSLGTPELEFPHPVHSPEDAKKYEKFLMKVITDKVIFKEDTDNIVKALEVINNNQAEFMGVMKKMSKAIGNMQKTQAHILSSSSKQPDEVGGWS